MFAKALLTGAISASSGEGIGDFGISPAVSGKTQWSFSSDGDLNLDSNTEYTVTPNADFTVSVKMWGAGGARGFDYTQIPPGTSGQGDGGGGGYSSATITFRAGSTYYLQVGGGGIQRATGTGLGATYIPGGIPVTQTTGGAEGGGYSGIFKTSVSQANALLIAGGGGGGSHDTFGVAGAGGGATAQSSTGGVQGGGGGSQAGGGSASIYNSATAGSALTGGLGATYAALGGGGGGYYGGGGGNVAGGGGGSGRAVAITDVTSPSTLAGSGKTPANSADTDRAGAGDAGNISAGTIVGSNGRIVLVAPP